MNRAIERFAERSDVGANRAMLMQSRARLKEELAGIRAKQALAAAMPVGSQQRAITERGAAVELEELKYQIRIVECRVIPSFNAHARRSGMEDYCVPRSG